MNAQQVGYITLVPSIFILFAIFCYVNTWRSLAKWTCRGAKISSLFVVIPSLGIFAKLVGAFDFGTDGTSFAYGVHLDAEATKATILWAGGWMPILGIVLYITSIGGSLILDEDRSLSQMVDKNRRLKKTVVIKFAKGDPDKIPTQVITPRSSRHS